MADQKININIGTSWNGAGMNKAMGAVQTLSQTAGKAAGAVGRLGSAFEGIGGEVSKSVGAIAGFAGAFASGGVVGLAIAGVTALAGAWQKHNAELEETKKKTKELELDRLTSDIKKYGDEVGVAAGKVNTMTNSLIKFISARQKTLMMRGNIEAEQIRMGAEGKDDEEKAKANLEATKIEQASSVEAANAGVTQANLNADRAAQNLKDAVEKLEELKGRQSEVYDEYKKLLGEMYKKENQSDRIEAKKKAEDFLEGYKSEVKKLKKAVEAARDEDVMATHGVLLAKEMVKKALLDQEKAIKKATDEYEAATPEGQYRKHLEQMSAQLEGNKEERNQGQERERMINEGQQYLKELEEAEKQAAEFEKARKRMEEMAEQQERVKELEAEQERWLEKLADLLGMTKDEIKKKDLTAIVNMNGGGGNGGGNGGGGGGSLFDPAGAGQPNGGLPPWMRFREGAAANNEDNPNGGVFARPKDWIKRNAKSHANLWRKRGWDPETGKPLEEAKKPEIELAKQTILQLQKMINDAQKPHIAK